MGDETLSIPPTLLITCLTTLPNVGRAVTMDLKRAGNRLYAVGVTRDELGGSHYLAELGLQGGTVPCPDLTLAPKLFAALFEATKSGRVASAHDLSEGGLAVAAAEMAFAGELGARIDLAELPYEPGGPSAASCDADSARLFSESASRFLVEVAPEDAGAFEEHMAGLPCARIGEVSAEPRLRIDGDKVRIDAALSELRAAFQSGFQG